MSNDSAGWRGSLVSLLETLSSRVAQEDYEQSVPIAQVPAELICGWFDDLYHPGTPLFEAAFSPGEREVLADFNAVFAGEVDSLDGAVHVSELWEKPGWARVSSAAGLAHRLLVGSARGQET